MLRLAVVLLLLAMPAGAGAAVQDTLAAARDLYVTADYREALAMLTRLRAAAATPADATEIDQYRAFALFALGQAAEAELVVEGIASADPTWTLPSLVDQNPLVWMAEVNGILVDLRDMQREVQVIAYEKGLIPYIPADRE